MASLRRTNDSDLSSDEIRDRLYKLFGGGLGEAEKFPRLRKFIQLLEAFVEDAERDYLTPTELCICVGTLLMLGGVLTGLYKMYMFLSEEEDRIIREFLRRRDRSGGSGNSGNSGSGKCNNNNNNSGGNKEDDH